MKGGATLGYKSNFYIEIKLMDKNLKNLQLAIGPKKFKLVCQQSSGSEYLSFIKSWSSG